MSRFDLKKPETVVTYADDLEEFWKPRNDKMSEYDNLMRLEPTVNHRDGHTSITLPIPWVVVTFAASLIATHAPKHRIPYTYGAGDNEFREARSGKLERYLIGMWRQVDTLQARRRRARFIMELATWSVLRGWIAGVCSWTGESPLPYNIRLWDPFHVYPDPDLHDLVTRRYFRSSVSVLAEYPRLKDKLDDKRTSCDVIDIWHGKYNGVVVDGHWAKKPTEHGMDYSPVIVLPVGGYPVRSTSTKFESRATAAKLGDNDYVEHMGQSVLYGAQEMIEYMNLLASQVADTFGKFTDGITVTKTEDGRPIDVEMGDGDTVAMRIGESIEVQRPPSLPGDLNVWMSQVKGAIDLATFPNVMYGVSPQELSGFARSLIHNAGIMRIGPHVQAVTEFYRLSDGFILEELERFAAPGLLTLRGTDYTGNPFSDQVDLYELRNMVAGDYEVEPDVEPFLPQDRAAKVAMAAQLNQQRQWSRPTINEILFSEEIQDAQGEEQRISDQLLKDNPKAIQMMAEATAPIAVARQLKSLLSRGSITKDEYELGMLTLQNQLRIERGAQNQAIVQLEGPAPGPTPSGQPRGPRGEPQEAGAFPPDQRPAQTQLEPEILAPQLQGSPSPNMGG